MVKYKKIANILLKEIEEGLYNSVGKLPTEEQLVERFGVSKATIRNAVDILCNYGVVYQLQGSGMFVRNHDRSDYLTLALQRGLSSRYGDKDIRTQCLEFKEIQADEKLADQMKCAVGTPLHYIERLRIVDGFYYSVEYTYYNKDIIPYLNKEIIESSIYKYIQEGLKMNISFADKYITSDKLCKKDAGLLHLKEGDPALIINDIAYLSNGTIFNYSKVIHNYQKVTIFAMANNI